MKAIDLTITILILILLIGCGQGCSPAPNVFIDDDGTIYAIQPVNGDELCEGNYGGMCMPGKHPEVFQELLKDYKENPDKYNLIETSSGCGGN